MFFKRIVSEGLAHYSYLVGDKGQAFVIDPRRDVEIYLDIAMENGLKISHIFETHRNEDIISGSMELGEKTGADIYISSHEDLDYDYGIKISHGDEFQIGDLKVQALHTPGHTLGHMSYVLYENKRPEPYMVFTGDCLFMGDLGRTDFYGEENLDKMTGYMYDSLYEKLLPLGDEVLVFPAHGAGSACGETMEKRPYSSIGYEKNFNPHLQYESKEEFIEEFGKMRIKPRYFDKMEVFNIKGAPFINNESHVKPIKFEDLKDDHIILDIRTKEAYMGGHIKGSYYISVDTLSTYLGTLFELETPLVLLTNGGEEEKLNTVHNMLRRIGFDNIIGYLADGINNYREAGKILLPGKAIDPKELLEKEEFTVLDVRDGQNPPKLVDDNTVNIPLKVLYKNLDKLDKDETYYVMCDSGERATTAASYLVNHGFNPVVIRSGAEGLKEV